MRHSPLRPASIFGQSELRPNIRQKNPQRKYWEESIQNKSRKVVTNHNIQIEPKTKTILKTFLRSTIFQIFPGLNLRFWLAQLITPIGLDGLLKSKQLDETSEKLPKFRENVDQVQKCQQNWWQKVINHCILSDWPRQFGASQLGCHILPSKSLGSSSLHVLQTTWRKKSRPGPNIDLRFLKAIEKPFLESLFEMIDKMAALLWVPTNMLFNLNFLTQNYY